ncbi:helix-turn-helix transcriptional regulator [Lentzea cavernae]|uniref:helix-turn-helix transcriptional regulator n=1 Tax=Lentzea cavernae TaxID=2020703 RepID=UPI00174CED5F|nr:helix-turn-helix transcriptional regulator [Lentzea cavernae]
MTFAVEGHESCAATKALAAVDEGGHDRIAAVELAEEALASPACAENVRCVWRAVSILVSAGEVASADAHLLRLRDSPVPAIVELLPVLRAQITRWIGDLLGAREQLTPLVGRGRGMAALSLVEIHLLLGDAAKAEQLVEEHDFSAIIAEVPAVRGVLRSVHGLTHLYADRYSEGLEHCLAALRYPAGELASSFLVVQRQGIAALAAMAAGQPDLAASLARQQAASAQAWGGPINLGWSLYVLALVQDDGRQVERLRDAVDLFEFAGCRMHLSEASRELAVRLALSGDPSGARHHFDRASRLAAELHSDMLARRIAVSLDGLGTAVAGPPLTEQERRIAWLARDGLSNKDIAARTALTVRTVEFHLSSVYRKRNLTGRRELLARNVDLS